MADALSYVSVQMTFQNLSTNTQARLEITSKGARWSSGPGQGASAGGITVGDLVSASIPLKFLELNATNIYMSTASSGGGQFVNVSMTCFLAVDSGVTSLKGEATLNPECQISVIINNQQPMTWASGPIAYDWSAGNRR